MPTIEAAPLTEHEARRVLQRIDRLYQQLTALPWSEQPSSNGTRRTASPAYLTLEAEIKQYADQYRAYEAVREAGEKCRMAKADLPPRTPRRWPE